VGYQLTSGSRVRRCQANQEFDGLPAVCSSKLLFVDDKADQPLEALYFMVLLHGVYVVTVGAKM